jgi:hypothetical protein
VIWRLAVFPLVGFLLLVCSHFGRKRVLCVDWWHGGQGHWFLSQERGVLLSIGACFGLHVVKIATSALHMGLICLFAFTSGIERSSLMSLVFFVLDPGVKRVQRDDQLGDCTAHLDKILG